MEGTYLNIIKVLKKKKKHNKGPILQPTGNIIINSEKLKANETKQSPAGPPLCSPASCFQKKKKISFSFPGLPRFRKQT